MKLIRTIYWIVFAAVTLLLVSVNLPYFWYLNLRGQQRKREKVAWKFAHWWGRVALNATGSKVTVRGSDNFPPEPVVIMGNHQSYFDIMLILGYIDRPLAFIAKQELVRVPLFATWMRQVGCVFLDREDMRQAARVFQVAVKKIQEGCSMVIFPEGTRSRKAEMDEFKRGSMKLALRAKAPIVPISIDGTYKIFEGNGYRIGPADIKLVVSAPIFPHDYAEKGTTAVADMVQTAVDQGLQDSTEPR